MRCRCCGKELGEFTTDIGYQLPDVVWSIPEPRREKLARYTSDLCQYGERFFLRGLALVPIIGTDEHFGWGLWVEVSRTDFDKYVAGYDRDGTGEPPIPAKLANTPPGYQDTASVSAQVFFGPASDRPRIILEPGPHQLAREQATGITIERVHELNDAVS